MTRMRSDRDLRTVEFGKTESGEELTCPQLHLAQIADRVLLPHLDSLDAVGGPVDTGEVTADGDVLSQLVELPAYGEVAAVVRLERLPVLRRNDAVGQHPVLRENGLEHCDARSGDDGVTGRIRRMRRAAFRIGLRQKVRTVLLLDEVENLGPEDVFMEGRLAHLAAVKVDAAAQLLRPRAAIE